MKNLVIILAIGMAPALVFASTLNKLKIVSSLRENFAVKGAIAQAQKMAGVKCGAITIETLSSDGLTAIVNCDDLAMVTIKGSVAADNSVYVQQINFELAD